MYQMDFFGTIDYVTGSWLMPLGGLLTAIFVGFVMKKILVKDEFTQGTTMPRFVGIWLFLIRWLVPIAMIIIILDKGNIINFNALFQKLAG